MAVFEFFLGVGWVTVRGSFPVPEPRLWLTVWAVDTLERPPMIQNLEGRRRGCTPTLLRRQGKEDDDG